ncbi:ATP-dependent Clp protease ATP-binding subunit [Staphylococcus epidermidis]|nr:ATP-dependent Clp protease ATP-binding subunit [Staphylococcus epidermidis]MCG1653292.1 ATP-dependent Clp protease ATP-binding subunit [Staphylococcus epidermidis]MCG1867125.1 ATP-dependent Clp protease ATP-binding subunit [Staphylococcus epidermidis]MCG1896560.1 ATP-dependent Clp protease ATP-binding subunit [Staphylococcus epidermidis]
MFLNVNKIVSKKKYKIIESQDLLLAFVITKDTGASYALGHYSITKRKIKNEISSAQTVKERYENNENEEKNEKEISILKSSRKKRIRNNFIKENPVQFIKENSSNQCITYMSDLIVSQKVIDILDFSEEMRFQNNPGGKIDTYWILMGIAQDESNNAYQVINKLLLKYDEFYSNDQGLHEVFGNRKMYDIRQFYDGKNRENQLKQESRENMITNKLKDPNYSLLEDISVDITEKAHNNELMPVVGREKEIQHIEIALSRKNKNNVALIGQGGVGKSAIVDGLALKIVKSEVLSLKNKRILQFNINDLISVIQSDYNHGIQRFVEEMKREKDIILFIDEIHMLGKMKSLTDILKPIMARGDFRIIGATTPKEWRQFLSQDTALVRRFEKINVKEPSVEDAMMIVRSTSPSYENFHRVNYDSKAIESSVKAGKKFFPKDQLPDIAFTILDNAAAIIRIENDESIPIVTQYENEMNELKKRLHEIKEMEFNEIEELKIRDQIHQLEIKYAQDNVNNQKNSYKLTVTPEYIKKAIEQKLDREIDQDSLIQSIDISESKLENLKNLKASLSSQIIGQDEAIELISNAIVRKKIGFKQPDCPIGVFMLLGTSGVGKTETAKILNKELYNDEKNMIRFDMSEYQKEHEVSKLIGPPPGYVGFGQSNDLVKTVLEHPNAVILFDEIEKAHPKIFDILLQVFDDGRLTNSADETADFSESIILLTSNIGASDIRNKKVIGLNQQHKDETDFSTVNEKVKEALTKNFRPEFLNRIDEFITFKPLRQREIFEITQLLIDKETKLIEKLGYEIIFSESAILYIAKTCFDPKNGARPIKRGISKLLENRLSESIINGDLKPGNTINVSSENNQLLITYQ